MRYRIVHIVGISICLMGVGCLVLAGIDESKDPGINGKLNKQLYFNLKMKIKFNLFYF